MKSFKDFIAEAGLPSREEALQIAKKQFRKLIVDLSKVAPTRFIKTQEHLMNENWLDSYSAFEDTSNYIHVFYTDEHHMKTIGQYQFTATIGNPAKYDAIVSRVLVDGNWQHRVRGADFAVTLVEYDAKSV